MENSTSYTIEIIDIGVGTLDGLKVFIDGALPGETVRAKITTRKRNYAKADLLEVLTPSPDRVKAPCPFYPRCGGCQLQHLSYPGQLRAKHKRVYDALTRIAKLSSPNVPDCIPSPSPWNYRHKIQMPVQNGHLGLYARGTHDLVPIDHCMIHCERGIMPDVPPHISHIIVRTAYGTDDQLTIYVGTKAPKPATPNCVFNYNPGHDNVILSDKWQTLAGPGTLQERLCGIDVRLAPGAFFQVNPAQAEQLYRYTIETAQLEPEHTVLDAYCGVGILTQLAAQKSEHVIGVDIHAPEGSLFRRGRIEDELARIQSPDLVFLNPPRSGCDPSVLTALERWRPKRILYTSCDPATLARDITRLPSYRLVSAQPFDMFPQTLHIETCANLCLS